MFGFDRKRKYEDAELGQFTRVGSMWYPVQPLGPLAASIEGDRTQPSPAGIETARRLLEKPQPLVQAAESYLASDARVLEFIDGNGELVCDGFTVYQSGAFAVEFSLTDWPDAMITVQFEAGAPCKVLLGD